MLYNLEQVQKEGPWGAVLRNKVQKARPGQGGYLPTATEGSAARRSLQTVVKKTKNQEGLRDERCPK